MKIKSINPNISGNFGLVNQYTIQICQLSGSINFIFKNHVKRTSYTSFRPNNQHFMYTSEVTDRNISYGVIHFKMALDIIKSRLVIDHKSKERELEDLTLEACQNNVCTYLTTMKEKKIEVDTICKDGTTYNIQQMNTLILDELFETACKAFLANVKQKNSLWIKDPATFNTEQKMVDLTNLYNNYNSTGIWDAHGKDAKSMIVALATALNNERAKNSTHNNPQGTRSKNLTASPNDASNTPERTSLTQKEISLFGARSPAARTEMKSKVECICLCPTTTSSGKKKQLVIPLGRRIRRLGLPQNAKKLMMSLPFKKR